MKKILIIITLFLVLGGITAYRIYRKWSAQPAQSIETIQMESGIPVRVFTVEVRELKKNVSVSGTIEAVKTINIAPVIMERIEAIHVTTGQKVTGGELLVTLDAAKSKLRLAQARQNLTKLENGSRPEEITIAQAQMEQAQSRHNLAQIEFERQKELYQEQATTQQQYQDSENQAQTARAALQGARAQYEWLKNGPRIEDVELARIAVQQAQKDLEDHYLYAPFAGVVSRRLLEPGDIAEVNKPLFQLLQIDQVYLVLEVSELYIPHIKISQPVTITIDTLPDQTFAGEVAQIDPIADKSDRSYLTKILLDNHEGGVLPGMFGRAHIITEKIAQAPVVPPDAIRSENGRKYALIVDDELVARKRPVTVGDYFGSLIHITSGLKGGDKVISLSQSTVQPGSKVKISDEG